LIIESNLDETGVEAALQAAVITYFGKSIPVLARNETTWHALVAATLNRIATYATPLERFAPTDRALWMTSPVQLSTSALMRAIGAGWVGEGTLRSASAPAEDHFGP
jgi:uncharacterized protein (DUF1697 family)